MDFYQDDDVSDDMLGTWVNSVKRYVPSFGGTRKPPTSTRRESPKPSVASRAPSPGPHQITEEGGPHHHLGTDLAPTISIVVAIETKTDGKISTIKIAVTRVAINNKRDVTGKIKVTTIVDPDAKPMLNS